GHGKPGISAHLLRDRLPITVGEIVALRECREIGSACPGTHFGEEWLERRRPVRKAIVVPGGCGIARQEADLANVETRLARTIVQDGGLEDDAVGLDAALLQCENEPGRAQGAVTLAIDEFRRVPTVVECQIAMNGARKRVDVRIDT